MRRIYAFAIGLVLLVAPLAAASGVATAGPGPKPMDYQQVTDAVIARGLSQRGVPYSWGGGGVNGPSLGTGTGATTVGFDASGLIQYAYAAAGLKLPRSSGQMYRVGQQVLPGQAQKGDLLFYGPEGTQSVAMFLGNQQMLEVGDVVQVSPVRSAGMAPYLVRILGAPTGPAQTAPAQTAPAQTVPGQTVPSQTVPGQTVPSQTVPGQTVPSQTVPGQTVPAQTVPGQTVPSQTAPAQTVPGQIAPAQTVPGQVVPSQPAPSPIQLFAPPRR